MNVAELEPLKTLKLPIVVPKVVPGLTLKKVLPLPDEDGSGEGYRIEWTGAAGTLALNAASGGIGDPAPGAETIHFHSRTFGPCTVEVEGAELATGWMSEMESGFPAYSLVGHGVPREQFLEVAQSLDYVKL